MVVVVVVVAAPFSCPYPTVAPDDPNAPTINDGSCALPCPSFLFSEKDYDDIQSMIEVTACISFVFDVYLVVCAA